MPHKPPREELLVPGYGRRGIGADLHIHTTASTDATLTPRKLVLWAARHGVRLLAVTDHDSFKNVEEARGEAENLPRRKRIVIIPGSAEINVRHTIRGHTYKLHLLTYYNPLPAQTKLFDKIKHAEEMRRAQALDTILDLNAQQFETSHIDPALYMDWRTLSKRKIAYAVFNEASNRERLEKEGIRTPEAFRRKYLVEKSPLTRHNLQAEDVIRIIRSHDGHVALAHPGIRWEPVPSPVIEDLMEMGLDGLEVAHPAHSAEQTRRLAQLSRRLDLVPTIGTDLHHDVARPWDRLNEWHQHIDFLAEWKQRSIDGNFADRLRHGVGK